MSAMTLQLGYPLVFTYVTLRAASTGFNERVLAQASGGRVTKAPLRMALPPDSTHVPVDAQHLLATRYWRHAEFAHDSQ